MIKNSMSLKAKINNIAKEEKVAPQAIMQTYMLERLLERISVSDYKNNFILKGGMLISSIKSKNNMSFCLKNSAIKAFFGINISYRPLFNTCCLKMVDNSI